MKEKCDGSLTRSKVPSGDNKENIFLSKNISKCERPQRMELQKANQLRIIRAHVFC